MLPKFARSPLADDAAIPRAITICGSVSRNRRPAASAAASAPKVPVACQPRL
jgi:hypothetical protein